MQTKQANFKTKAKVALAEIDMSVTELAKRLQLSRNAVSRAINRNELPTVRVRVEKELGL